MKSVAVAVTLIFAGLVAAQSPELPDCAKGCVTQYTTGSSIAGCGQIDIKCICSNSSFLDGIACCLADACPPADLPKAVAFAKDICKTAGVTVPDEVVCKNKTSTSTSASAATTAPAATTTPNATAAVQTTTARGSAATAAAGVLGGVIAAVLAVL